MFGFLFFFFSFTSNSHATCPSTETVLSQLTCSSTVTGALDSSGISDLGGTCSGPGNQRECFECGSPYAPLTQTNIEDVYSFTCQADGDVTMDITGMDCDLDIYVLDDTCDPYRGCEEGSTQAGTSDDAITFTCQAGQTYYVVVEGYGFGVSSWSSGYCDASLGDGGYTLSFDTSAGTGCPEDCLDGIDNDLDGDIDCDDSDCSAEPLCSSCDVDGDGYDDLSCGGTDCDDNDPLINPGVTEVCDGLDNDCDTLIDEGLSITYYEDTDGDGYGDPSASSQECQSLPGYVLDDQDCNDSNGAINPGAPEICDGLDNDCDTLVDTDDPDVTGTNTYYPDTDNDGFGDSNNDIEACSQPSGYVTSNTDCNDTNNAVYPGALEICDGLDNDCDTIIDEGLDQTWYADTDGDGFGDSNNSQIDCIQPSGFVGSSGDCNDNNNTVYPGASEVCDGVDNDCDSLIDEGLTQPWYVDSDGDAYGDLNVSIIDCVQPSGYVGASGDCDDTNNAIYPGAPEVCDGLDNDCDLVIDEGLDQTWYADTDNDGFGDSNTNVIDCSQPSGYVSSSTDCDDTNPLINPGAPEICDGLDNDCDTQIDEGLTQTWFSDSDGDNYGDPNNSVVECVQPSGYVGTASDCDDSDPTIYPGANEVCDGLDNDCDTQIDEGLGQDWYADTDGDSYGNLSNTQNDCVQPSGYVSSSSDCDDTNNSIYPGAPEVCDGLDNDCDTLVDEGLGQIWYADSDGDTYGDSSVVAIDCIQPSGYVSDSGDCNDSNNSIYPGAPEICDGLDNDCDTQIDEGLDQTWYADNDNDNYGNGLDSIQSCSQPSGYISDGSDCDDGNNTVYPSATEICDGLDNDCDSLIDEGLTQAWYADADNDSYGNPSDTVQSCLPLSGYVTDATDCNDNESTVYPGAPELCDGLDNDCDAFIDEGLEQTWYIDGDGDSYGDPNNFVVDCAQPSGYVTDDTDCDDTAPLVNPGEIEVCDLIDNDCDGDIDEGLGFTYYYDNDNDGYGDDSNAILACSPLSGYTTTGGDCDDTAPLVNPGEVEVCDLIDNDCDGDIDEGLGFTYYYDNDNDGFGDDSNAILACSPLSGYITTGGDCNDNENTVYPGAPEICDGLDNDCNGDIDDGLMGMYYQDSDSDGFGNPSQSVNDCQQPSGFVTDSTDCNDNEITVYPGAPELCDGLDNDCDALIDEGLIQTWYLDNDGDSFGEISSGQQECSQPSGYVNTTGDCDDNDATVYPSAPEICDGLDNDCDALIDEGLTQLWYADSDGDSYGDFNVSLLECSQPSGYVSDNTDCNDNEATVYLGAPEICDGLDNDCDTLIDEGLTQPWYVDFDGDSYGDSSSSAVIDCVQPSGYVSDSSDCDDNNSTIYPSAPELCDGLDNDCDTLIDEGLTQAWYLDNDGDSYGDSSSSAVIDCVQPSGYVSDSTDCNDNEATVYPGATEVCDGLDNDCDSLIDEGLIHSWFVDSDGDSFGDSASSAVIDCIQPSGYVLDNTDCNDVEQTVYPGAPEICDGLDNDCNTLVDEGLTQPWYVDNDGDSYGDSSSSAVVDCIQPSGYVSDNTDCDDNEANVYPNGPELCDGLDNDCDSLIDEGLTNSWYPDSDGDSYGDTSFSAVVDCIQPSGYVLDNTDCDDAELTVYPGAPELCDGLDNDCNTLVDEGLTQPWYVDNDGDSYGDPSISVQECIQPSGYVSDYSDCDDLDSLVNPGQVELCDGIDNDCDTLVDEGLSQQWFVDNDGDTFGDINNSLQDCNQPSGYVLDDTDCDDSDPLINIQTTEIPYDGIDQDCSGADICDVDLDGYDYDGGACFGLDCNDNDSLIGPAIVENPDGVDEDCDSIVDEETIYYDDDGDGYTEAGGDCDDSNALIYPNATETCDGYDEDCDGVIDNNTDCYDDDGDGYSENDGDCNDNNTDINPGAVEIEDNGIDDNCDGQTDSGAYDPDGDGYTEEGGDCDNLDPKIYPDAEEEPNGIDDDCDGEIDEGTDAYDDDGDGFSEDEGDCNDSDDTIYEGAEELANGYDDDCDGEVDEGTDYYDDDGDGYTEEAGDCDDTTTEVAPDVLEVPNGIDDDCDGEIDEGYSDLDGDGYTETDGDCDDSNGWVAPDVPEMCDGIDNNCDGNIDEDCELGNDLIMPKDGACNCSSVSLTPSGLSGLLLLLGVVAYRRRENYNA